MQVSEEFQFVEVRKAELKCLSNLAKEIWPITFSQILSTEQIDYMLSWMYDPQRLTKQMEMGHQFYFLITNEKKIGFVGIEENYPENGMLRIHKIYLKPDYHGQGLGKFMMDEIEKIAHRKEMKKLHLNVNRFNSAVKFYQSSGFEIIQEVDIEIGSGYLMEDFVMMKFL